MARLTQHGLRRTIGAPGLFATAYGNVGSSIYYALGLVASYALGLTPVVFILTGFIFYLTAATYAEATAMYPEAGGSSSFARHAFNEFWSFFAGWAQMLNYTITVAISAFFVPHYLGGIFWPALQHGPGDVLFGGAVVIVLSLINVVGVKEAAGLNIVLAVTDLATQLLLVLIGIFLVLSPHILTANVHLGVAPTWKSFLIAIPIGMIAYTGIETISNMAEEARDETKTVPRAIKSVVIAVFAIYAALPMVALSALPVYKQANGQYATLLGTSEAHGGYSGDPVLGIVKHLNLGSLQSVGEIYVGLLAATILFIAANAGIIGVSRLVYSMGLHRQLPDRLARLHPRYSTPWIGILFFGGVACLTIIPGKAEFLGNIYAFGLVEVGVIAIDGTKVSANASMDANQSYERILREILAEATETDRREDELLGDARGDELPEQLRTREGRRQASGRPRQTSTPSARRLTTGEVGCSGPVVTLDIDRERLVNSEQGRRGWQRQARRALDEKRRQNARPIAGARPERLQDSKSRLEENHRAQLETNAAYDAYRETGRDRLGRRLSRPPDPRAPPETPAGTINTPDHDSRIMPTKGQPAIQGYNAQAAVNEKQIIVGAEISVETVDFGHLEPLVDATISELGKAGVRESPETVVADPGYWHKQQMENIVANKHIQVLIPPDSGTRKGTRPGWNKGLYAHMRRVLQTELGQTLCRRRMATVEPVFGQNKFNRGFRRFQRRRRAAAESEWRLQAATHNLLKLHSHRLAAAGP